MKLTFLGVSDLLSPGFNSNMFLESEHVNILIDAGMDIKHSLLSAGKKVEDIDVIYLSHTHCDHFGGLEYLGYYAYYLLEKQIELYIHSSLYVPIFEALKGTLGGVGASSRKNYLERCFKVRRVENHKAFIVGDLHLTPIKNKHIDPEITLNNTDLVGPEVFSYGLVIDRTYGYDFQQNPKEVKSIYISTDTTNCFISGKWPKGIRDKVGNTDIVFHDCDLSSKGDSHPHYDDLRELPEEVKKKMWLYHYNKSDLGVGVGLDGFAGLVAEGQVFEF